ncbi:PASTA domain-containing protein [Actinoplanes teichomyceticus]|uniref:PASTA domain-containing protein n=2 Tax=Actinoplanes teichomyceticus TaxID=1867 RepID=A0A561WRK3_ACTTI|nr:PASTA domain-containing protein [Actinoplanes teichomyceticus]GIF11563.1 hypothetical protein Ate01nite_15950 [Actinoplanes teichomyceticus]
MPDEHGPGRDADATRPDATRPMPAADDTVADETVVRGNQPSGRTRPGDDPVAATRPMAPVGGRDPDPRDADDGAWTGRAAVRPPRPEETRYDQDAWTAAGSREEPSGRWWMPIVVGVVGLVLLALLGFGIYLVVQNSGSDVDEPSPTPAQTRTVTRTTAGTPPTTTPTTAPTVSTVPTTEPTVTEALVPALRGMPLADAQAALDRSGLGYRVIYRAGYAEPGTVIDSDPAEGQAVPPDTRVTLVVAAERAGGPATTTTAPAATAEPGED